MPRVDAGMVTCGVDLPGYRIVGNFGIVRGIVVRSRSLIGNLGAALQTIGAAPSLYLRICARERARRPSSFFCDTLPSMAPTP